MSTHVTTAYCARVLTFLHSLLPLTKFQEFRLLRLSRVDPWSCSVNIRHMPLMLLHVISEVLQVGSRRTLMRFLSKQILLPEMWFHMLANYKQ